MYKDNLIRTNSFEWKVADDCSTVFIVVGVSDAVINVVNYVSYVGGGYVFDVVGCNDGNGVIDSGGLVVIVKDS